MSRNSEDSETKEFENELDAPQGKEELNWIHEERDIAFNSVPDLGFSLGGQR